MPVIPTYGKKRIRGYSHPWLHSKLEASQEYVKSSFKTETGSRGGEKTEIKLKDRVLAQHTQVPWFNPQWL